MAMLSNPVLKTRKKWHGHLLCALKNKLIESELKELKQLIETSSQVPRNLMAEAKSFFNLWGLLERLSLIKVGDYDFLKERFKMLQLLDSVEIINEHTAIIAKLNLQEIKTTDTVGLKNTEPQEHQTFLEDPVKAEDFASARQPLKPATAELSAKSMKVDVPELEQKAKPEMEVFSTSVKQRIKAFTETTSSPPLFPQRQFVTTKASVPNQQPAEPAMTNASTMFHQRTEALMMTEVSAPAQQEANLVMGESPEPVNETAKPSTTNNSALDQQKTEEEKGPRTVMAELASRPVQHMSEPDTVQVNKLSLRLFHEVRIDGETYSLDTTPMSTTKLVRSFKDILTDGLHVPGQVTDLEKVINGVRLVYCGRTTCKVLADKIEEVGLAVAKICHRSAETVTHLKYECVHASDTLELAHTFLVDGREGIAISNLKDLEQISKKIRDASNLLISDLDQVDDVVLEKGMECLTAAEHGDAGENHVTSAFSKICAIGLLQIHRILENEKHFWCLMCNFCEGPLAGEHSILKWLNNANEKRISKQWWGSAVFRKNVIHHKSMWVALRDICQVLEDAFKEAKKDTMMTIKKILTADEAKKMLPLLMKGLDSDLNAFCTQL